MRYVVREYDDTYGVWDTRLLGWMLNEFEMSKMAEGDAEDLAADLNEGIS